jgi:hypothetical protein
MSHALLHMQIQSGRAPELDLPLVQRECEALSASEEAITGFWVDEGDDDGRYINLNFETEDKAELWRLVRTRLYRNSNFGELLATSSITVCTGNDGWSDYLLLHHFDPAEQLDALSET